MAERRPLPVRVVLWVVAVLGRMLHDLALQAALLFSAVVLVGGFLGRPPAVTALSVVVALVGGGACVLALRRRWPLPARVLLSAAVVGMDFAMLAVMGAS